MKYFKAAAKSLPLILMIALALRAGYAWDYRHHRSSQALGAIPFLFEPGNIAASIAAGQGFSSPLRVESGPTAWMTPVYPLLLAGVFRLFGIYTYHSYLAAVFLNILFSVLTCIPIFFVGKKIGGTVVGAAAAWLWTIFPNAVIIPVESMWDASLAALLSALILWLTLQVAESARLRNWCAYGALWGIALMTNAALLAALPFLLGWMANRVRRKGYVGPALAAVIVVLCCAPWTVRNYLTFHAFVPLRSVMGLALWLGAIDPAQGRWPGSFHPIVNSSERDRFVEIGELAYMREKRQSAVRFIAEHPGTEARLSANRFVALWTGGTSHPVSDYVHAPSLWFRVVLGFNAMAASLGLAGGVVLYRNRDSYAFPVIVFPIAIPVAYYLTFASARYRHPIDPELLLLAAIGLLRVTRTVKLPSGSTAKPG